MFSKLALFSAMVSAAAIPDPTFTKVFDAVVELDMSKGLLPGPFGRRLLSGFISGNLTDASTGALVANVIPNFGAEFGLVTDSGHLYTDVRLGLRFVDEDASAFLELHGSGTFENLHAYNYLRVETNSTTYGSLVDEFLYASIDVSQSPAPLFIYKLDV
ncbi:hypothetical protein CYLTODRAFT_452054 [Cylindrobasidium torrendii FP15055 ss-10]|uniref:Uncharacterized protein n=1 Tax=Cylindrobasidium torrendii FP15055 ss-10 TaxID=1314674 RepID=A0A0D7BHR4_9AGAR|nr:hypothetical protein CYLTODRAFT_452054 [Cylindrobasidium torrendii FP15055 ss-10]